MGVWNKTKLELKNGDTFGRLEVIDATKVKKGHNYYVLVRCNNCKKEFLKPVWWLVKGQQCQCVWHEMRTTFSGYEHLSGTYYSALKLNAKARNLEFLVTKKDLVELLEKQDFKCALSGIDISLSSLHKDLRKNTASLDRIDSSRGYVLDNLQWVHKDINIMKNHYEENYFVDMCKLISKFKEK